MIYTLFVCLLPFALSLQKFPSLLEEDRIPEIHRKFHDIVRSSDHCLRLHHDALLNMNHRNFSIHIDRIQRDLYEKYYALVAQKLPDEFIESLLGMYCKARSEMVYFRNTMRPPAYLKGNFTWDFEASVPENNDYHMAKFKERVMLKEFNNRRRERILEKMRETEAENPSNEEALKKTFSDRVHARGELTECIIETFSFYRTSVFIIAFSLSLTIRNILRRFYATEDDNEGGGGGGGGGEEEGGNIQLEMAHAVFLALSLMGLLYHLGQFSTE